LAGVDLGPATPLTHRLRRRHAQQVGDLTHRRPIPTHDRRKSPRPSEPPEPSTPAGTSAGPRQSRC
jgi:hypothetical protein